MPHAVSEEILARKEFRDEIAEVSAEMGLTLDEGLEKAEECLDELVAVQSRAAVDMFYAMMGPLHSSTWQVLADESGLARLRELNKRYALVFLPAHRSYVDTLVLGDVLARNDFPRNHVMGGANLRIWPISDLARRAGIVFIRRSFGDDEIYKAVVQEYFAFLLSKRFNLEWYFEGGRSRTGKIRSPRYGLLRYVARRVQSGRVEDVYLVPTSITYDRLHEVSTMAAEQAGAKKQAEGLKWLAEYARSQRRTPRRLGARAVRRADPDALVAASGRRRGRRQPRGAAQDRLRGRGRHQPHLAADRQRAAGPDAAGRPRPVADADADPAHPRTDARLHRGTRAAVDRAASGCASPRS